jgi:hypothetical protein
MITPETSDAEAATKSPPSLGGIVSSADWRRVNAVTIARCCQ